MAQELTAKDLMDLPLNDELKQVLLAILPSDVETASFHSINFTEAIQLYGTYQLPLTARLGRIPANGVTHYYGDKAVPDEAANAQADAFLWSALTAVDNMGDRRKNTCQIMANAAAVGGSAQAEAQAGAVLGITDLISDQRNDAMEKQLKDIEYGVLNGNEATASPRQMNGLLNMIIDNSGTNNVDGSAGTFDEAMLIGLCETIRDEKTGFFPNALYASGRVIREIGSFTTDRITYVIDPRDRRALTTLAAGQAAGYYVTPNGEIIELFYHPMIAHSGTAANNYMLAVYEPLVKMAFLRGLRVIRTPPLGDSVLDVILCELTLQFKVPTAHGRLHNYALT